MGFGTKMSSIIYEWPHKKKFTFSGQALQFVSGFVSTLMHKFRMPTHSKKNLTFGLIKNVRRALAEIDLTFD